MQVIKAIKFSILTKYQGHSILNLMFLRVMLKIL